MPTQAEKVRVHLPTVRTRFLVVALCVFGTVGALLAPGCNNQGEGDRCDKNNNLDDDCNSPLVCTVTQGGTTRCCPPPGTSASAAACKAGQTVNDSSTPEDTGSTDTGTGDGDASDSGSDAPSDAPTDAANDADSSG